MSFGPVIFFSSFYLWKSIYCEKELDKMKQTHLYKILPQKIRHILEKNHINYDQLQEIRMREEKPLFIKIDGREKEFLH